MLSAPFSNPRILNVVDLCISQSMPIPVTHPVAQAFFTLLVARRLGNTLGIVVDDQLVEKDVYWQDVCSFFGDRLSPFPSFRVGVAPVPGFVSKKRREFECSRSAILNKTSQVGLVCESALAYSFGRVSADRQGSLFLSAGGESASRDTIIDRLEAWGYKNTDCCVAPNTYATRGGIIDLYPTNTSKPIRVEFFSNQIESVRYFDEKTQRSECEVKKVFIFPPADLDNDTPTTLNTVYKDYYKNLLYITPTGLGFAKEKIGGGNPLYVESVSAPYVGKKEFVSQVESWVEDFESVFVFNPAGGAYSFPPSVEVLSSPISSGFRINTFGLVCVPAPKNTLRPSQKTPQLKNASTDRLQSLSEIEWGDYLVHVDFGIGTYRGLSLVGKRGAEEENIKIEYQGGAVVHVPVNRFGRVHKYIGTGGNPPQVSRLGSGLWEKQKQITKKSVASVVDYLIKAYNARMVPRGFSYTNDSELMSKLEQSFPHRETEDQLLAIQEINGDLDGQKPMDRLLYGDVGFGKTEVAIRAAMRAVISSRCVFFLAPTTVLSDQHYITCKNRLCALGVSVELLSRFKTRKQQQGVVERLHLGKIDVLVGTRRILGEDVPTKNLGLLIVDEEQRFGVKHKEAIRRLKNRVDILTLTATPIPRTLQQSLMGVRDTSKIKTPPRDRHPIETVVGFFDWGQTEAAIRTEIARGGQVYFLHNDISALPYYFDKISELFPDLRISIAHGQMNSRELEKTILAFFDGTIDVLLCTTIIESGLDVQNANTIIINNAQNLGLAQLYQIRGRVGRASRQAFCFLFIPKNARLLPDAYQRLRAIEHYSSLGSGYGVAMRDLEIRGAGNLFGYEQSGEISKVGFELYNKILSAALDEKRSTKEATKKEHLSIVFPEDAYLGSDYIPIVQDRLDFYQKVSSATSNEELQKIKEEALDRFGRFSNKEKNFFLIAEVQCRLYQYPFTKCVIGSDRVAFTLSSLPEGCKPDLFFQKMGEIFGSQPIPYKISTEQKGTLEVSFLTKSALEGLVFALKFDRLFSRVILG